LRSWRQEKALAELGVVYTLKKRVSLFELRRVFKFEGGRDKGREETSQLIESSRKGNLENHLGI
jgi:hypothetical protein